MKMRGGAFCNELVVRRVSEAAEEEHGEPEAIVALDVREAVPDEQCAESAGLGLQLYIADVLSGASAGSHSSSPRFQA